MTNARDDFETLRREAIALVARIRIALPYRRATQADLVAVRAMLDRMRGATSADDARGARSDADDVLDELQNFAELLEILTSTERA